MNNFKEIISKFQLEDLLTLSRSEQPKNDDIYHDLVTAIDETLQYHSCLLGEHSRYPDIFTEKYLLIIIEHVKKDLFPSVIKGQLSYTAYLFPESLSSQAFCFDLYQDVKSKKYIVITEEIKPVTPENLQKEVKEQIQRSKILISYTGEIRFINKNCFPKIVPLVLRENSFSFIKTCIQDNARDRTYKGTKTYFFPADKDLIGVNKIEFFLVGRNFDQYFYVNTNSKGGKTLYRYNLLEGALSKVTNFASAKPESEQVVIDYIISKLINPQYTLEFEVYP